MNNINANAKEIVYKNYNIYVGKRLSAGVADSLLHRTILRICHNQWLYQKI